MAAGHAVLEADRATARSTPNWLYILSGITILILALSAARFSLYRPINADEAYNLQIAKSIGTHFCYCTMYRPERVYPVEESTNGIAQYAGGLFFAVTHSPDAAKAGTAAAAILVLGAVLLVLDPWLVLLTALLFLLWYSLDYVAINFLGEIWAIAFSFAGIIALRRCDFSAPLRKLLTSRQAIFAAVSFGIAAESKLLAVLVIVPAIWAIAYQRSEQGALQVRAVRASSVTAALGLGTGLALLLLIAFSVIHSTWSLNLGLIWQTFTGFIFNMMGQGQGQAQHVSGAQIASIFARFDSPIVLVLVAISAAILLYANWAYAFFLLVTLVWWLHYGVNERHVVISLFAAIILGAFEAHALLKRIASERNVPAAGLAAKACGVLAAVVLTVGFLFHGSFYAPGVLKAYPDREHFIITSAGHQHYSERLVDVLRRQRYVAASGWWQFPELTLRENLEFYDRMSPANAALPKEQVTLMFDTGNKLWPATSVQGNCDRVIYTEGPIVLCTAKRSVPLDFQPAS